MKVKYYDIEEGSSEISGEVTASVDLVEGEKADVFFRFWWNRKTRSFSTIDNGELSLKGRALAYFYRYGNMGHWNLKEHRDNYPDYSELVRDIYDKLVKELETKFPVDPSEYMEY